MDIGLRQLRHIAALAEHGVYTRAADALGISQPALSRSIQKAEQAFGAPLFDRTREGVLPTAIGRLVVAQARRVLQEADQLDREVKLALAVEVGQVRVGVGPYPAEISVGTAAGRLAASRPGLRIELVVGHWEALTAGVAEGDLDLAITEVSPALAEPRLSVEPLPPHQGRFFCRAGHPLATRTAIALQELEAYPWSSPVLPERFPHAASSIRADTFQLAKTIVLESDALGLASASMIREELGDGRLVILAVDAPWLTTRYGFIRLADRTPSPAALAFMEEVRAVEADVRRRENAIALF